MLNGFYGDFEDSWCFHVHFNSNAVVLETA